MRSIGLGPRQLFQSQYRAPRSMHGQDTCWVPPSGVVQPIRNQWAAVLIGCRTKFVMKTISRESRIARTDHPHEVPKCAPSPWSVWPSPGVATPPCRHLHPPKPPPRPRPPAAALLAASRFALLPNQPHTAHRIAARVRLNPAPARPTTELHLEIWTVRRRPTTSRAEHFTGRTPVRPVLGGPWSSP